MKEKTENINSVKNKNKIRKCKENSQKNNRKTNKIPGKIQLKIHDKISMHL
jgi:hypothetical protein